MLRARAAAESLAVVGEQLINPGGADAARVRVAELYLREFGKIAKEGNTVLLPADAANPANMVAQAMAAAGVTAQAIPGYEGGATKAIRGASSGDAAMTKAMKREIEIKEREMEVMEREMEVKDELLDKSRELLESIGKSRTILSTLTGARSKAEGRAILSSN